MSSKREVERWATARKELLEAEALYAEAKKRADVLATAFAARDLLLAELPDPELAQLA